MKILFMTPECSRDISWNHQHHLEQEIDKIAECKWAGHGHPLYSDEKTLNYIVGSVMSDVDWVILSDAGMSYFPLNIHKREKRSYKIACITSDLHYPSPKKHLEHLNLPEYDAFLMQVSKIGMPINDEFKPNYFINRLKAPIATIGFTINPDIFKPIDEEKKYDIFFSGAHNNNHYPLRYEIYKHLPTLAQKNNWSLLVGKRPPGRGFNKFRTLEHLFKKGWLVGRKYAEVLARSKILIFGSSQYRYPVKKYFEGMASKTCVMSDTPANAEELCFHADWNHKESNYVEIEQLTWKKKLEYYLEHDDEREEIAKRGYETIMKYHTNKVRAKQIVNFLEKYK